MQERKKARESDDQRWWWWGGESGNEPGKWARGEMRSERRSSQERYHLPHCCLVSLCHQPSVIMALIAEDQHTSAREPHVNYRTFCKGKKYVRLEVVGEGCTWISPASWQLSMNVEPPTEKIQCYLMLIFKKNGRVWWLSQSCPILLTDSDVTSCQPKIQKETFISRLIQY